MTRRRGAPSRRPARPLAALLAALLLALTACSSQDLSLPTPGPGESDVDVDTPRLRTIREDAGIEPCAPGPITDGPLPAITLACLGGGTGVDLSTLQGPMVINLWAANCTPCRTEMPALQAFHEQYGDQVGVLGIDYSDVVPEAALLLARKTGVTYPLVADPGGEINDQEPLPLVRGLPYLLFLGADGEIGVHIGGVKSEQELVDLANDELGLDL